MSWRFYHSSGFCVKVFTSLFTSFNTYTGSSSGSTDASLAQFSNIITNTINNGMTSLNSMVENRKNKEDPTKSYKAITSFLAISTEFINPIAELAIVFLPEIINFFSENMQNAVPKNRLSR